MLHVRAALGRRRELDPDDVARRRLPEPQLCRGRRQDHETNQR